jgi:uncharacterized protein
MDSRHYLPDTSSLTISAKIVIAGGFGVGKTTFVSSVSEVEPINTEAWMTVAGDDTDPLPKNGKSTTTVAMDFGRISLQPDLVLFLFGTPGQPRFWFLWDDLCRGALGAVVLVNTQRIEDSFPAINYFEKDSDIPFIVAVNMFNGEVGYELAEIREALTLGPDVPLTVCDARDPGSTAKALQELVSHTLSCTVSYGPEVTWGYHAPQGRREER